MRRLHVLCAVTFLVLPAFAFAEGPAGEPASPPFLRYEQDPQGGAGTVCLAGRADACGQARLIATAQPCVDIESCEALQMFRRQLGEPGLRHAAVALEPLLVGQEALSTDPPQSDATPEEVEAPSSAEAPVEPAAQPPSR